MRLANRTAVITGAASGYGAGIARRFAAEGARVACVDINRASAAAVASSIDATGQRAIAVECDIASGESVRRMVDEVVAAFGSFDTLVNNAALTQRPARIAKIAEQDLDRLLAVNVKSLYHMAVHALPVIRKGGGGVVINVASVTAIRPRPGMTWYNATKAAMINITQTMAAELAPDKIRVNAVAPVAGRTPMLESMFAEDVDAGVDRVLATIPLGRLAEPDDIAGAAVYLASDDASLVTGIVLPVDGGRLVA